MNHGDNFDGSNEQTNSGKEDWTAERLSRASYKELGTELIAETRFRRHLLSSASCRQSLENLLLASESTTTRDYSVEIDVFELLQGDNVLGHLLLRYPESLIRALEHCIVDAQREILQEKKHKDGIDPPMQVKGTGRSRVHARLVHLPPTCCKLSLGSLAASDVGKIVQCKGTVVRATTVCMYESLSCYKCTGKQGCGKDFNVVADLGQKHNALVQPIKCNQFPNCKGKSFTKTNSVHTDYQEVSIQESASQLGGAHVPRSLLIKLQHDLCDTCQPGDEVIVVGVLRAHWHKPAVADADCQVGMALVAMSIRVIQDKSASAWTQSAAADGQAAGAEMDEDKFRMQFKSFWEDPRNIAAPIAARDYICKAVCPKLYGMAVIKLALLITLIGGVCQYDNDMDGNVGSACGPISNQPTNSTPDQFSIAQKPMAEQQQYAQNEDGMLKSKRSGRSVQTRRRGQSHLLLVGDPGTGKSQFLRFAAAICPRSVLTTGVGTTSAGLTCAAVRENGKEFSLEAGALVLADQGVCCIDEFGCIRNEDRCTIHEAMEQQTLSVAKAGIVCKLNCRATIVAVMNPRDCVYDNRQSLSRNTGLGTPLLSRFDTIFKLVDSSELERDSNVTKYLLNRSILTGCDSKDQSKDEDPMDTPWSMDKLRAYISYVRESYQPDLGDEAATLLENHYEKLRSAQSFTIPVTVRFLESLIRLSQAHARLMCHGHVKLDDAVAVIRVMECTAFAYGGFDDSNVENYEDILYCDPMTIDFSEEADLDFLCFKARILERYRMQSLMSPEENQRVATAQAPSLSCSNQKPCSDGWEEIGQARFRDDSGCGNEPYEGNVVKRRRQR